MGRIKTFYCVKLFWLGYHIFYPSVGLDDLTILLLGLYM